MVTSDLPVAESSVQCLVLILLDPSKAFHCVVLFLFFEPFLLLNFKRQHAPGFPPLSLAAHLIFPQRVFLPIPEWASSSPLVGWVRLPQLNAI